MTINLQNKYFSPFGFEKKIKLISFFAFLITAFFSIGHHQSDEHYQILEFARYKLGYIPAEDLAWEFSGRLRPTLQPWMAVLSIKFLNTIGIINPFTITFIFRLLSGFLTWVIIGKLNRVVAEKYFPDKPWDKIFYISTYLLWFIPYISVRFSSENLSMIFLLTGIYFLLKKEINNTRIILAGILLGLSVLFRYQSGLAVFGIALYLMLIEKVPFRRLLLFGFPIVAVLLAGVLLDSLFYDEFVLTIVNYFKVNLIEGKASEFGTKPWWFFFVYFISVGIPPLSLVLFVFFFYGVIRLPKNIFTWTIVPFLFIHMLIPHKEMRFLFPVVYPFVFIAIYGIRSFFRGRPIKKYQAAIFKTGLALNFLVLAARMLLPADEKIYYYRYLYNHIGKGDRLVTTTQKDIYKLVHHLRTSFYTPSLSRSLSFASLSELRQYLETNNISKCFYVHRDFLLEEKIPGYKAEFAYSIYPGFLRHPGIIDLKKRMQAWSIYLISKE